VHVARQYHVFETLQSWTAGGLKKIRNVRTHHPNTLSVLSVLYR